MGYGQDMLFLKGSCERHLGLSLVALRVMDGTFKSWSTVGTPKDPWIGCGAQSVSHFQSHSMLSCYSRVTIVAHLL